MIHLRSARLSAVSRVSAGREAGPQRTITESKFIVSPLPAQKIQRRPVPFSPVPRAPILKITEMLLAVGNTDQLVNSCSIYIPTSCSGLDCIARRAQTVWVKRTGRSLMLGDKPKEHKLVRHRLEDESKKNNGNSRMGLGPLQMRELRTAPLSLSWRHVGDQKPHPRRK